MFCITVGNVAKLCCSCSCAKQRTGKSTKNVKCGASACVGNKSARATVPKHQCQGNHENFQLRFRDLQIGTIQDFAGFGHFRFELDYVLPRINYDIYIYTDKYCKYDKAKSQCRVALPNSMGSETVQGIHGPNLSPEPQ